MFYRYELKNFLKRKEKIIWTTFPVQIPYEKSLGLCCYLNLIPFSEISRLCSKRTFIDQKNTERIADAWKWAISKSVSVRNQVDFGTIRVASVSTVMIICNWNYRMEHSAGLDIVEPNHNKEEQRNKYNNTSPATLSMFRFDHQGSLFKFNAEFFPNWNTSFICWSYRLLYESKK